MVRLLAKARLLILAGLVALGAFGTATPSYAFTTDQWFYNVPPNGRVCLPAISANYQFEGFGTATPGARFVVTRANPADGIFRDFANSPDGVGAAHFPVSSALQPGAFPGLFKLCARNTHLTRSANIHLWAYPDNRP
jgi:hypothetical protein